MLLTTLNAIVNSFNAASTDVTRYHMTYVRLTAKGKQVQLEASDGHVLSTVLAEDEELAALVNSREYAVSPDAKAALKALAKDIKTVGGCISKLGDNDSLVLVTATGSIVIETTKRANIMFPQYQQVKPKLSGEEYCVSFNPNLLMDLYKALNSEKRNECVTLILRNPIDPIVVDHGGQRGVLMPMRSALVTEYQRIQKEKAALAAKESA